MAARTLIGTKWSFGNNGAATSIPLPARTITAGSLVFVSFRWESGDIFTGVSDTAGGTWSFEKQFNSNVGAVVAWSWNHPGGTDVVITGAFSGNVSYRYAEAAEFSGGDTEDPRTGAAVKSNAALNHSVSFTPPGLIFSTQSNYSGSSYTVVTGTELGKGSYHCTSYILNQTTSPGAPQHTGGSGSTASISVAFAEPVFAPTAPIIVGPLEVTDRTYDGYTVSGWTDTETGTAVDDWQYRINGGSWVSLGSSATEVVITGRTHGDYDDVEVRALDADDAASNVLAINDIHVGFEVYDVTALAFAQNGTSNSFAALLSDLPRNDHSAVWWSQWQSQSNYYGGFAHLDNRAAFDSVQSAYCFLTNPYPCDGTFDEDGQRLVFDSDDHYFQVGGLRIEGASVSRDSIASPESIVGVGNQESYPVDKTGSVWVVQARQAKIIDVGGVDTVEFRYFPDLLGDPTKVIITRHILSHATASGSPTDPKALFGAYPWTETGTPGIATESPYGRHRGFKFFTDGEMSVEDLQAEAAEFSNTPVTSAGTASIYFSNINPTLADVTDKSGEGNNLAWRNAYRPSDWSGEIEVEIEEPASAVTQNVSLALAVQLARSAAASVAVPVQAPAQQTASVSAAIQSVNDAQASLAAAVSQARAATALVALAVRDSRSATSSVALAVQRAESAVADLDLAVQRVLDASAGVDLQVQAAFEVSASIRALVQAGQSASMALEVLVQQARAVSADLAATVMVARSAAAGVDTAVQTPQAADLGVRLAIEISRTGALGVDLQVQDGFSHALSLSTAVQLLQSASASLSAAVSRLASASTSLAAAVSVNRFLDAEVDLVVQALRQGAVGVSAFVVIAGQLMRWDGAAWEPVGLKRFDGADWIDAELKRWDGADWA